LTGITVSSKAHKMIVVSREYPRLVRKYKRYERSSSKVHAFLPSCIDVKEGDEVKIAECKPISKTVVVCNCGGNKEWRLRVEQFLQKE